MWVNPERGPQARKYHIKVLTNRVHYRLAQCHLLSSYLAHGLCRAFTNLQSHFRHGEVYVTDDHNITTGKIYQHDIEKERVGHYLGKTVQVVPHITNAIQDWIERVARIPVDDSGAEPDICIIELGRTVGGIESAPFIHAVSQLQRRAGKLNFAQIYVSYVPALPPGPGGEQKTKPTQKAVSGVRSAGLNPDFIACRCEQPLEEATISKIANMCQMERNQIVAVHNVSTTYHVPLLLEKQKLLGTLSELLGLSSVQRPVARDWVGLAHGQVHMHDTVSIALVGKYTSLHDAYISLSKSFEHSSMCCRKKLKLVWVDASHLEDQTMEVSPADFHKAWHDVCTADGVYVPGGFGERASLGMIKAITWAYTKKVPFLGICLGMQLADAGSEELHPNTKNHVIIYMPEVDKTKLGGIMRLDKHPCIFQEGTEWSKLRALYGSAPQILERHRHRYEVNPTMVDQLEKAGLAFVGKDAKGERMEIIEICNHPWFVASQYHPEYLSWVLKPSKTVLEFFGAAAGCLDEVTKRLKQEA
ncbi:putative CTP synthase [Xylogone sp. PMI_703]|nr:putative CTP synthase [Xylogone sp. PMI_703]